jgi:hypothetical protein
MVTNGNVKLSHDKHHLNSVIISVLKIKTICGKCFMKMNVYSFQKMVNMHVFYGGKNGNSREAKNLHMTFWALAMKFQLQV